jgi:hypothetical protein
MKRITLQNYRTDPSYPRIVRAVEAILAKTPVVAPVELFVQLGLLQPADLEAWRFGRVPYLEKVIRCNLEKASRILRIFWMHAHDLTSAPRRRPTDAGGEGTGPTSLWKNGKPLRGLPATPSHRTDPRRRRRPGRGEIVEAGDVELGRKAATKTHSLACPESCPGLNQC